MIAVQQKLANTDRLLLLPAVVFLSSLAAFFLILGSIRADLQLSDYGLADSFPPIYYAGLILLTLSSAFFWFVRRNVDGILLAHVILLIAALWLVPYLLEETPRFRAGYKNFSAVDILLSGRGLTPGQEIYHNWPLFPVLNAGLIELFGVSPEALLGWFPIVIEFLYLVPLVLLIKLFGPQTDNRMWAGIWFFYIMNWTGQDYFSPQAFAFLLLLIYLFLLAKVAIQKSGQPDALTLGAIILLFVLMTLTHALTSFIALLFFIGLLSVGLFKKPSVLIGLVMVVVGWQLVGAAAFYEARFEDIVQGLVDPAQFIGLNVGNRLEGSDGHQLITQLRVLSTLAAFSLVGLVLSLHVYSRLRLTSFNLGRQVTEVISFLWRDPAYRFSLPLLVMMAVVAPVYVYGGEVLIRILLFSLPLLAIIVARSSRFPAGLATTAIVLTVMTPVHVLTHYGNEAYDYVSPQELDGFAFIRNLGPANIYGGYPGGAFRGVADLDWRHGVVAGKDKLPEVEDYLNVDELHWEDPTLPTYVAVGRGDDAAARLFYKQEQLYERTTLALSQSCHFEPVFQTSDYSIYRRLEACIEGRSSNR